MRVIMIISFIYGLTLGFALSVDAFMLSLVYGSTFKQKTETIITGLLVGSFHFSFLLLGYYLAAIIFKQNFLENKIQGIAFIILLGLGLMMVFKNEQSSSYGTRNLITKCLFAFSVSVDSFLAGIALTAIDQIIIYLVAIVIAIISFLITLISLSIGKKSAEKLLNANLEYYAGIIIIILAIISLFI